MFGRRWCIFRLFGIPISVDASWLIILALITWSLAEGLFGRLTEMERRLPAAASWALGFMTAIAFFICVVLHEIGHSLVARAQGMPIRGITLFLFGGVAELEGEPPSARAEFWMAIAGPIVSAFLAGICWLVTRFGIDAGWPIQAVVVFSYLTFINLLVLGFNLIPAFPLDGGRVLRSILWGAMKNVRRATYVASFLGQAFAWLLITVAVLNFFYGYWANGLWLGLIGLFLNNAAQASYQQILIRQALHGEPVRRFMNTEPIVVPRSLDLQHWVEDYVYRFHRKTFPVASNGRLEGFINTQALANYPRGEWDRHTVGEAMNPDLRDVSIPPDTDALDALGQMQRTGSSRLLVTEGDRLVGIVSLKDLLRFLNLKLELEGVPDGGNKPAPPVKATEDADRLVPH
jgi:Zn-dependent protease